MNEVKIKSKIDYPLQQNKNWQERQKNKSLPLLPLCVFPSKLDDFTKFDWIFEAAIKQRTIELFLQRLLAFFLEIKISLIEFR